MERYIRSVVYIILILLAGISVLQGVRNALQYSQDFQYDAALALRSGINPYEESLAPTGAAEKEPLSRFYGFFEERGISQKMEANQFPSLLMILFPMTLLPYGIARVFWLIINLVCTVLSAVLLRRTFMKRTDRDIFNFLMLLMVAGMPWRNQIGVGQHTVFSLFFFLLAVYLSEKDQWVLSGLSLSVSFFKYTLTAPLAVYFIYRKRYRELMVSLVPHIMGTAVAAGMLKSSFIDMIREPLKVSSALASEGSIDIGALTGNPAAGIIAAGIIMFGIIVCAILIPEGRNGSFFSLLLLLSLIMTYHRIYDFFVLIPAACGTLLSDIKPGSGELKKRIGTPEGIETVFYLILVFYFFFVLRIFNESPLSLRAAAVIFYGYIIFDICLFWRKSDAG